MKKGAKKQRLLWASTSVKNPAYSDTLYVAPLIGPDTVSNIFITPLHFCWLMPVLEALKAIGLSLFHLKYFPIF